MKKIERPESTTIVDDVMFHLVKNQSEFDVITTLTTSLGDPFVWRWPVVDRESLVPMVAVLLPPNQQTKLLCEFFKYVVPVEYIAGSPAPYWLKVINIIRGDN